MTQRHVDEVGHTGKVRFVEREGNECDIQVPYPEQKKKETLYCPGNPDHSVGACLGSPRVDFSCSFIRPQAEAIRS